MPSLDNVATADDYTAANTLYIDPPVEQVTIIVSNNPVFVQFATVDLTGGLRAGANSFEGTERRLLLASWEWTKADLRGMSIAGVRVRSAVTGLSGNVTIHG